MRRMLFGREQPAGVDLHKSSASLRRLSSASEQSSSFKWGWSRSETTRLVRLQAVVRGFLLRRKVCRIPARDLEAVLKDLNQKDKGLRRLVAYLCFFLLFFAILLLESDVSSQHAVEIGIKDFINQVTSGPDGDVRLADVTTREDFSEWALSLFYALYDGTEIEDVCNTCAGMRAPGGFRFFPEVSENVWGTEVPFAGVAAVASPTVGGGNGSFVFKFDNCPLCYGPERASVVGEVGSTGDDFCAICSGLEYCFEGRCADYDEVIPMVGEVKGTNASLVKVFSNADCYSDPIFDGNFPRDFLSRVGVTSVVNNVAFSDQEEVLLLPRGRGHLANKNKMIGALLMDWTYYEEGACENSASASFYSPCYRDAGSWENMRDDIQEARMNRLISVDVKEGRYGEGLVYSVTNDAGLYNTGLNINICGMLSILGGPDIMTGAVRTVSLRLNAYNGQTDDGLFSSVQITAKFTLGGEVQIDTEVQTFSMPSSFYSRPAIAARAVAVLAFALLLARYIAKDVRKGWRELKDGKYRLSVRARQLAISTATVLNLTGDCVFLWNLFLWATAAATAWSFELNPALAYNNPSAQVRAFSEELASVALERWKRDAAALAGSIFGLARLFLMLRFHPRLSLVTDVLASSAVHLVHFFIMFFTVIAVYSNLGWVIFGPSSILFATWTTSFVTMTRIALGEFDNMYPLMMEINETAALIIIITYQTLQGILLLNIVISILLDGFQMVQDRNSAIAADTLRQTVMAILGRWRIRLVVAVSTALRRNPCTAYIVDDDGRRSVPPQISADTGASAKSTGWWQSRRQPAVNAAGLGPRSAPSSSPSAVGAAVAGVPGAAPPGVSNARSAAPAGTTPLPAATPEGRMNRMSGVKGGTGAGKGTGGLTRGQRLAVSNRHYDIRAAVEVLRRSPLPEAAVLRKMRQIVGARLGWVSAGAGTSVNILDPGRAARERGR